MTATTIAAVGRRAAEKLMTDACTVRRLTGRQTQDETTGQTTPEYTDLFTSVCRLKSSTSQAPTYEAGARPVAVRTIELHLPFDALAVEVGDVAEVTASYDPNLVGHLFRIVAPFSGTYVTSRRLYVEEVLT